MRPADRYAVAITVACVLASFMLSPLTQDSSYLGSSWLLITGINLIGLAARRTRLGSGGALAGQLMLIIGFLYLLSRSLTATAARADQFGFTERVGYLFSEAAQHMQGESAPMSPDDGVKFLFVASLGLITVIADLLVVTLRKPALGLAPLATVFLVPAIGLGTDTGFWPFLCLSIGYVGILIAEGLNTSARWTRGLSRDSAAGSAVEGAGVVVWRAASYIAVPAMVFALIAASAVPTLAVGSWGFGDGAGGGGGPLRLSDPTLDLKRNLTVPQNRVVLTYRTDKPGGVYLRLASLPSFSNAGWQNAQTSIDRGSRLPQAPGLTEPTGSDRRTEIKITDFASEYLPLPFAPRSFEASGAWGYDPNSLVVISSDRGGNRNQATQGLDYTVVSRDVNPNAGTLERSVSGDPPDSQLTTAVPQNLPGNIRRLAVQITTDENSPAAKAAAIQAYLRDPGNFTYSTDPRPGSGYQALENFLFRDRHGYCEQFAAAMAVMARAVGIPSRVAVGFLPGRRNGDVWTVTARDSHAWPELYFAGYGWVRYEPTPSSVTGTAPSWSVAQVQTQSDPSTANQDPHQPTVTARPSGGPLHDSQQDHTTGTTSGNGVDWGRSIGLAGGILVGLLLLATPATVRIMRRRTRLGGSFGDPADQVEAAWAEVRDTVRDVGRTWPSGSPRSIAESAGRYADQPTKNSLRQLAVLVERGRYSRRFTDSAGAAAAAGLARTIRHGLMSDRTARSRLSMLLTPRSVFRRTAK